jgi:O-succinylbenzoate synthase
MMIYDFAFQAYRRRFHCPLQTAHGEWSVREGILIRLTDEQKREGWGEIAPLPWFGSETLEQALALCEALGRRVEEDSMANFSDRFPASQFAFETALENLKGVNSIHSPNQLKFSYLLPNGSEALTYLNQTLSITNSTFKWKIGVDHISTEIDIFQKIIRSLTENAKIRLDANGGLTFEQAKRWLERTEPYDCVEFIEQPLSPQQTEELIFLSENYRTPLALDEAIANLRQLQTWCDRHWQGVYVIKPAIIGSPGKLRQFCRENPIDTVFSSVFETKIGRQAVLNLATELASGDRALGFGLDHWLAEEEER